MNSEYLKCSGDDCFNNNRFHANFINGIVDHVSYRGISIEQRPEVLGKFHGLIGQYKPQQIIEIGTFAGGFTLILKDIVDSLGLDTALHTYDVNNQNILKDQINYRQVKNIFVHTKNLFSSNYDAFVNDEARQELVNIIQNSGLTMVLCDGGCKKCEFNIIAPFLKSNDIIMAHDYAPNSDFFHNHMNRKIWNWHEIQDSDIQASVSNSNLMPLDRESFLEVAWLCMRKV